MTGGGEQVVWWASGSRKRIRRKAHTMTTYFEERRVCAVCRKESSFTIIGSTSSFGAPDLDLRPPPLKRFTLDHWVHECPFCGYVAAEIDEPTTVDNEFLRTEEYRNCDGHRFREPMACLFYRQSMIAKHDGKTGDAFHALLHAAWVCDDARDRESAAECRRLAIPLVSELIDGGEGNVDTMGLIRADLMRRAGLFAEMEAMYASVRYSDKLMKRILAFQRKLAKRKDTEAYRVSDVP